MFKAIKDNKIIAISDMDSEFPCLICDSIANEPDHTTADYVQVNGEYVLTSSAEAVEQREAEVRAERDEAINAIIWRVQRYEQQKLLGTETTDSEQVYMNILEYIQYLRDIPNTLSFPDVVVMSFEEWKQGSSTTQEELKETTIEEGGE